jgi:DNA polymerase elongation subunit (family B)
MPTLIFDIETVGEDWSTLDNTTKAVLTRWTDRVGKNAEEKLLLQNDIESGLGFSPLTGYIVAIGLYDLERKKGVIYYSGLGTELDEVEGEFTYKQRSETVMLREFWEGAAFYDTFVTFNGRSFDAPFLVHRSAINGIRPTKNLLEGRYPYQQRSCRHIDLQDELTFFGAMQRRPSLHLFCRAFGIESPKGEVGGDDVAPLFMEKKFRDIAHYNAKDVVATTLLYQKWVAFYASRVSEESPTDIDF